MNQFLKNYRTKKTICFKCSNLKQTSYEKLSFNVLQAYPEFRSDRDNKPYRHQLGWANKHQNLHGSHLSPELIALYTFLNCSDISNYQYADLRKRLLNSLNTKEFLEAYNEFQTVRDWPESEDLILRIFEENDHNEVKVLITGFDLEHFITWYPCVIYHYESSKRMNECYNILLSGKFNKNSHDGAVIFRNADKIKNAAVSSPGFSYLTPDKGGAKDWFWWGTDCRSQISWSAKSYIEDNFSRNDHNKVLAKFNTVEQRALQGKIIDNFNCIAKLSRNAPVKKQEFLKEAGSFSIIANEYNHCGLIELGNDAVNVCTNLLDFAIGVGGGIWQSGVDLASMVYDYDKTFQSLRSAAQWCKKLYSGSFCVVARTKNAWENFDIKAVDPTIRQIMKGVLNAFEQTSAHERGHLVGQAMTMYFGPKAILTKSTRLMASSFKTIKSLDMGNKVWRIISIQEKLALAAKFGPIKLLSVETANLMVKAQRAAQRAANKGVAVKTIAQNASKIAGLNRRLAPDFIVKQVRRMAKDKGKLTNFIKITGENLGRNGLPSSHGFEKYFAELKKLGVAEAKMQEIAQHAYNIAVKENKVHSAFSELGTMVQCAKGIMTEIASLNPNEIFHIMAEKHAWAKIVKGASNWDEVAKIMTKVMKKGVEMPHKQQFKKVLNYGGETIEVVFTKLKNKSTKIADA